MSVAVLVRRLTEGERKSMLALFCERPLSAFPPGPRPRWVAVRGDRVYLASSRWAAIDGVKRLEGDRLAER